jgi:hypothetical protein
LFAMKSSGGNYVLVGLDAVILRPKMVKTNI